MLVASVLPYPECRHGVGVELRGRGWRCLVSFPWSGREDAYPPARLLSSRQHRR